MAIKNDIIALLQEVEQGKYSNIVLNELFHKKVFKREKKFYHGSILWSDSE
ncbi:hypothetical protein HMPREF9466_00662 [Fusobacterium necrophorum subsp. funduliforme 1_1_36S]|nr:hypothetical protein HMPREF9466_00662 [Fusobacterium necrophorum subsp. funduliforme 1_1_36S]